jgi:hypothetical protein
MPTTGSSSFTATMWMINRVHDNTAYMRALSKPAVPASFANFDVLLIRI